MLESSRARREPGDPGTAVDVMGVGRESVIRVDHLSADYRVGDAWVTVVDDVSFEVPPGHVLGIAGESGCGKSTVAYALLGYSRPSCRIRAKRVVFEGRDLLRESPARLRSIRGAGISLVPQNPATALTPSMKVGDQIAEILRYHRIERTGALVHRRVLELLDDLGLPEPHEIATRYPHQLSGGQQQRVVLAMAIACRPKLLVLDEPTTGLDVTTQARIIDLLRGLRAKHQLAMVYVTHDLRVLYSLCDSLAVLYAGKLVEIGPVEQVFQSPKHPYTKGLLAALPTVEKKPQGEALHGLLRREELPKGCPFAPRCTYAEASCFETPQRLVDVAGAHHVACWKWDSLDASDGSVRARHTSHTMISWSRRQLPGTPTGPLAPASGPLVRISNLVCGYPRLGFRLVPKPPDQVVKHVSLVIEHNETFALVGETGSGKSTIARSVAGLLRPLAGAVFFDGVDITYRRVQDYRRRIQIVFQNPDASLNPRQQVLEIVGRPLECFFGVRSKDRKDRVVQLLDDVRLDARYISKYPFQLSGGERQRIALARALAAEPDLLVCDEILSALDVSVQSAVLDLLGELRSTRRLACLFITHDLAVVRWFAQRIGVLNAGVLCETGSVEEVYESPRHHYTRTLLAASPHARREVG